MALAASVAIPSVVYTVEVEAAASSFKDISANDPHKSKIDALIDLGVISGFTDNTFRPTEKVTRGQFAIFISRALKLPTPTNPMSFIDVGKTSAVYDGVIKAQAAGIISGYTDGRFRAGEIISRGDMAIMLDRALQYKSSFPNKVTLTYSDKGLIGKSALEPVQRLTYYKIMGALSGTSFSAETTGNRLETVLSIYQLLNTKNLLAVEGPSEVYPAGSLKNYSYAELVKRLGKLEVLKRAGDDGSIYVIDVIAEMKSDVSNLPDDAPALKITPEEFFESYIGALKRAPTLYAQAYPLVEYVSIDGVPFRETKYYPDFWTNPDPMFIQDITLNNVIPNPPRENGKFLIDLPSKNKDIVTYHSGKVDTERMASVVKKVKNDDYLVDVKSLFKDTSLVTVSTDGLIIQHNGKKLELQIGSNQASLNNETVTLSNAVISENGVVLVPFKSIAEHLNIYWREMFNAKRFELANYPLEKGILGWEE